MANSIGLASKFQPILDEIYKAESLTARLDAPTKPVSFGGANAVNVFKTSMVGLGNYSKSTGFPAGDVTGAWETLTLSKDRGRSFAIDAMDDEESLGMAFGTLVGEFLRTEVIPELDAYRFSTYASWTNISEVGSPAALDTSAKVLAAFDVAQGQLNTDQVPKVGRICYMADPIYALLTGSVTRTWSNENGLNRLINKLDNVEIIPVPQARFYKGITLDAGSSASAGGYTKTSTTGRDINFLLMHPSAVLQVAKHEKLRIFSPDENQTADAWKFDYRIYHDAFVYTNKVDGIYSHITTS